MYLQLTSDSIAKDWARRKPTRDDLHEFVERLVLLSLSPERVSMRTSSGVDLPGWDLILSTSQGNTWVPDGLSLWELGTEDPPKGKAEDDYAKRTKETDETVRKTSAFIFVTPHRWAGKQKWLDEKAASGDWREVRALDADDLFGWVITCVPAAIWLHRKIFNYSDGVETLEEWWERWSRNPPGVEVTPEILLTSRRAEVTTIQGWLTSSEPYHAVRSSAGEDEAIAFVFAAISDAPHNAYALRRALVVSRTEVWGSLIAHEQVPLLLIPHFAGPNSHQAVIHGHAVIEPISRGRSGFADLDLPSRDENEFCSLLEGVGFPSEDAQRLAKEAAADLEILKLNWKGVVAPRPTWSQGKAVRFLVPTLFVGGWDQSMTGDTEVLARLARLDYSSFEEGLLELVDNGDIPLTRRGNGWRLQRSLEVWGQLRRAVTGEDWDEFVSVAVEVLAAPDPARELPAEERWLAAIKDKRRPHSARLRQGIAQTLAMIASQEMFASLPGGRRGADVATEVVRAILDEANSQPGGDGWAAIRDELPLMGEAAPDALLNALHIGTSGSTPVVKPLFDEHPGFIFSQSDHPHLLWALERLAWSPEYLPAVAVLLAKLASMDPGGSHGPRPLETLNEIFFVVRPGTSANQEIRLKALDLLRRVEPDVAWPLLVKLVPDTSQVLSVPSKPEFRDWAEGTDVDVSGQEALKAIEQIIAWLLEDAGSDARRWAELVSIVHDNLLPAATREPVLKALEERDPEQFADADREPMATELRETVGRHTAFPDAKWAMNAEWIERLRAVAERFEPRDPVIRHRWLFEDWPSPERVRGETYEERQNRVDDERREALNDVLDAEGWDGIIRLVDLAESPAQVGRALATASDIEIEAKVLAWAKGEDLRRLLVIDGYSAVKGWKEGWEWTESAARAHQADWTPSILARFLLMSPEANRAWLLAAELGTEVEREYWREFRRFPSGEEIWEAVEKLIEFGRPFAAIDMAGARAASKEDQFRPDIAIRALEAAMRTGGEGESLTGLTNVQWDVAQLLKSLEEAGTLDSTLATFEWQFLAILEHTEYDARHLQEQLVGSPEMFAQIVSLAFISEAQGEAKEAGQQLPEATADEAALARQALKLLMNLRRSPGVADDGSMDASTLNAWVSEARQRLAEADRVAIGDQRIGHALWYAPDGSDSLHPHEAVRDLFEAVTSKDMELGFSVEAVNSRGVHARRGKGGDDERELATEFDRRAAEVESQWPRAGAVLHGIADNYRRWAERWDEDLLDED